MLDWPGRVSTTLFLAGCTLRCPYCHNPGLVTAEPDGAGRAAAVWEGFLGHLSVRRGWIDGVVVTGGEPTCDPGLVRLLEALAARGVPVKLDTNGTAPDVLEHLVSEGLAACVALDVKTFPDRYDLLGPASAGEAVTRCVDILRASATPHEVRVTVYPPVIDAPDLPALAETLTGCDALFLQRFRPGHTLDPAASSIRPVDPDDLRHAARLCSRYLPTATRGS